MQPVPDKHQRNIRPRPLRRPRPQNRILPQHQRLRLPVHHQAHRRLLRQHPLHVELHRLVITRHPRRLQTIRLELLHHISRRLQILRAPGKPPLHRVIRQILHMRPPGLALRLIRRSRRSRLGKPGNAAHHRNSSSADNPKQTHNRSPDAEMGCVESSTIS